MKLNNTARIVSTGGVFAALAVLFHSSPVFLPVIGLILSPFATLPIALSTITSTYAGFITLFAAALILFLISPQEALILLLTTGPLGLALGATFGKGIVRTVSAAGMTLFTGIGLLTYVAGIAAFGDITPNSSIVASGLIFLLFSIFYSGLWVLILRYFVRLLKRTRLFDLFIPNRRK